MMQRLTIAIAGCGPAGLATALLLHRDGHHVTLFDRFDTPRPVGSGLMIQPTGFAVLRELGLDGALLAHGARIDRLHGEAGSSGRVVLDVRYSALGDRAGFGVGVHRAALFTLLHDARPLLLDLGERGELLPPAGRGKVIHARYDGPWDLPAIGPVPAPTAVLIRPDGHVAWVGEGSQLGLAEALAGLGCPGARSTPGE